MNLDPFTGAGSTPARRRLWDQVVASVNASQKLAGRNVTVIEAQGMGTLTNVVRERGGPAGPCCIGEWPSITCSLLSEADCIAAGGSFPGGTTCEGVDCNSGACCETDGGCSDTLAFLCGDCAPGNSCWEGYGTACSSFRCEGVCSTCQNCPFEGCNCYENLTYDECQTFSTTQRSVGWLLGGNCAVNDCCYFWFPTCCATDMGACCPAVGACVDNATLAECNAVSGTWYQGCGCGSPFVPC